ncbi:hypothetical protein [Streptomyces sp. NBC_00144]|uniref:recombination directionality factor n=1 Tax=Streptomyces sp. NBC_00144 TaxID=2975665 RepID=UPI003867EFED
MGYDDLGQPSATSETVAKPLAGRFHVARQCDGRPEAVRAWRVTTREQGVASALSRLYGGVPERTVSASGFEIELLTWRDVIPIVMSGGGACSFRMVLRGAGEDFHVCDGERFLEPLRAGGSPCGCPSTTAARKAAAYAGRRPRPEVELRVRLLDLPESGVFHLKPPSGELAAALPELKQAWMVGVGRRFAPCAASVWSHHALWDWCELTRTGDRDRGGGDGRAGSRASGRVMGFGGVRREKRAGARSGLCLRFAVFLRRPAAAGIG